MPGIACPACKSKWATSVVVRPDLDVPRHLQKTRAFPISPTEFSNIADQIMNGRDEAAIPPGTWVGRIAGSAKGTFGDQAWLGDGDTMPLWRQSAAEKLVSKFNAPSFVPCRFAGLSGEDFCCPCLRLYGKLTSDSFDKHGVACETCGRRSVKLRDKLALRSVGKEADDIFRLAESPGIVVATNRFREFSIESNWTDLKFVPLGCRV